MKVKLKLEDRLNIISNEINKVLPEEWDGSTEYFENVPQLIQDQFYAFDPDQRYEISGKFAKNLDDNQAKVYGYLRFKGRATIRSIARLMKIPDNEAYAIASELTKNEFLISCM